MTHISSTIYWSQWSQCRLTSLLESDKFALKFPTAWATTAWSNRSPMTLICCAICWAAATSPWFSSVKNKTKTKQVCQKHQCTWRNFWCFNLFLVSTRPYSLIKSGVSIINHRLHQQQHVSSCFHFEALVVLLMSVEVECFLWLKKKKKRHNAMA